MLQLNGIIVTRKIVPLLLAANLLSWSDWVLRKGIAVLELIGDIHETFKKTDVLCLYLSFSSVKMNEHSCTVQ